LTEFRYSRNKLNLACNHCLESDRAYKAKAKQRLLVPDGRLRSPENNDADDGNIPLNAEEEEMLPLDAVPPRCPYLDDFIKHAALAAGKYGVSRDAITNAITHFHQDEGMDVRMMSMLTPATLVALGEDVVTEAVGMAIAAMAWERFKKEE
jgi:hypothetical protein